MSASRELTLMNSIGVLPFKRTGSSQWTVIFNNIAKTFGNVSDAMEFARSCIMEDK
jgi:hypothetical protein